MAFSRATHVSTAGFTACRMAAYDAELLHMKRDGRLKALYDKYGIPYLEP